VHNDYQEYGPLYEYINTETAKNDIILAPPYTGNMIPLFTGRIVIASQESLHGVYFDNYRESQIERTFDLFKLYSSSDEHEVFDLIYKYSIDYIVIDTNSFLYDKSESYYEPFRKTVMEKKKDGSFLNSYIFNLDKSVIRDINKRFKIVKVSQLLNSE
jgi:hypothetical protein